MEPTTLSTSCLSAEQKVKLQQASDLIYINPVFYYGKKIIRFVFEMLFYLLSVLLLIGAFQIPLNPVQWTEKVNDSSSILFIYHADDITNIMYVLRGITLLFAVFAFIAALLLGSIRRKNNRIKDASEIMKEILDDEYQTK